MNSSGGIDRTESDGNAVELQLNVLGRTQGRSPEGLDESQEVAIEGESGFHVTDVEIGEGGGKHGVTIFRH